MRSLTLPAVSRRCARGLPRWGLAPLIVLGLLAAPAMGQSWYVPGQWYDTDKYNDNGVGRTKNYWNSYNPHLYALGEDPVRQGWAPGCEYGDYLASDTNRNYAVDANETWQVYRTGMTQVGIFVLPCYWYDIDGDNAFTEADPRFFNLPFDTNKDFVRDPAEDWRVWRVSEDGSCWLATAANLVQAVSGANHYHRMAYVEGVEYYDWNAMENKVHYWDNGGRTQKAVESCGYTEAFLSASYYEDSVVWDESPVPWIARKLAYGLPVGLGVRWDDSGGHAFTVYGIDEAAHTLLIADSDSDRGGAQFYEIGYRWNYDDSHKFQIDWENTGDYSSIETCTSLTFQENLAGGPLDWFTGSLPYTPVEKTLVMLGKDLPCEMNVPVGPGGVPARAGRLTLWGGSALRVAPGAAMEIATLHTCGEANFVVDAGSLTVGHDAVNDGRLEVLPGSTVTIAGRLMVGDQWAGRMIVRGGLVYADSVLLGFDATKQGDLSVALGTFVGAHHGTLEQRGGSMICAEAFVGHTGEGVFRQYDGTHQVLGEMTIGCGAGSTGLVRVEGGSLTVGQLVVGGLGDAQMDLRDGLVMVQQNLLAGNSSLHPAAQQITMDGGLTTLTVGGDEHLGHGGPAIFIQADGRHNVGGSLVLGRLPGSRGDYDLRGGRLNASVLVVGEGASGFFVQGGGVNESGEIILGADANVSGRYDMNGGAMLADSLVVGSQGGGRFVANGPNASIAGNLYVGRYQTAVGLVEMYNSAATLTVGGHEIVGQYGQGAVVQKAGVHVVAGELRLGAFGEASGSFALEAGSLSAGTLIVGWWGPGRFTHDGGTVRAGSMSLGTFVGEGDTGDGTYTMRGLTGACSLSVAGDETVGGDGTGAFLQQTGEHAVGDTLGVGVGGLGVGAFTLSGGTLEAGRLVVGGEGRGDFLHQLGDVSAGGLCLGESAGGTGAYTMEAGTLRADLVRVGPAGAGTFEQQGGTVAVGVALTIGGAGPGVPAQYRMLTGELAAEDANITVLARGLFRVEGAVVANSLRLTPGSTFQGERAELILNAWECPTTWDSLAVRSLGIGHTGGNGAGTLTVLAGLNLAVSESLRCGERAAGTIRQLDGSSVSAADLRVGDGGTGLYQMTGASARLSAGAVRIGLDAGGTFEQTSPGGVVTISGELSLGLSGGDAWPSGYLLGEGNLTTRDLTIGVDGMATFTQDGGAVRVQEALSLGAGVERGHYYLTAGSLEASLAYVGEKSFGVFCMQDGRVTAREMYVGLMGYGALEVGGGEATFADLIVATGPKVQGEVMLSGPAVLSTETTRVGIAGSGRFIQTGGTHAVRDDLKVGEGYPYEGGSVYELQNGLVASTRTYVGLGGGAAFTQTGGIHRIDEALWISKSQAGRAGRGFYTMRGGTLDVPSIHLEGQEELAALVYYGGQIVTREVVIRGPYASMSFASDFAFSGARITITDEGELDGAGYSMTLRGCDVTLAGGYIRSSSLHLESDHTTAVLHGYGIIYDVSEFENCGQVIAEGGLLDLSEVEIAASSVWNPGHWGWFARGRSVLQLPSQTVPRLSYGLPWSGRLAFGSGGDLDLINSVNVWLHDARALATAKVFDAYVLPTDDTVAQDLPGVVLGVWNLDAPAGMTMDGATVAFRFDQTLLEADGWAYEDYERNIRVWHYEDGAWTEVTDWVDPDWYQVETRTVTSFSLYAVTAVPEPTTAVLLVSALAGVLLRRRRRRRGE